MSNNDQSEALLDELFEFHRVTLHLRLHLRRQINWDPNEEVAISRVRLGEISRVRYYRSSTFLLHMLIQ